MNIAGFLRKLSDNFSGDIEQNIAQRIVQATDNSIYQLTPKAIIYPKNEKDIINAVKLANNRKFKNIKFTARGAATGTNGQSLNDGIIIDCSRHFNKIIAVNYTQGWVEVEPGVTLKELNDFLKPKNYHFPIDISTADRATIGGMISTDACGKGSYFFGRTGDNLISAHTVLSNGAPYVFRDIDSLNIRSLKLRILLKDKEELIAESFPEQTRFASGYNLGLIFDGEGNLNTSYLLAGSEGTLGIITKARLSIVKLQTHKALIVVNYDDFDSALQDAKNLLRFNPYALETMDEKILELAKKQNLPDFIQKLIKDANNINILEFRDTSLESLKMQIEQFLLVFPKICLCINAKTFYDDKQIKQIWNLRASAVGIAGNLQGKKKPIAFIEDTTVNAEYIADYVKELKQLLDHHQLYYVIYGHLDVGCIHVRPALDLNSDQDRKLIRILTEEVIKLVKKYHGVVWGEHSAGFRVEYSPLIFGEEIFNLFCEIKKIFDPENRFNPGKIAGSNLVKIDNNLQADSNKDIKAGFYKKFSNALFCNGNAKCLSADKTQLMCPSYKVTRDKVHSPKGRANLIRSWLTFRSQQQIPKNFFKRQIYKLKNKSYLKQIYNALQGCLSCTACSKSCPLSVNIPTYKSLFLNWYHQIYHIRRFRDIIFAKSEELLPIIARFPYITNNILNPVAKLIGISALPRFDNSYYKPALQKHIFNINDKLESNTVLLLGDSFNSFADSKVLEDSISLLQNMGFEVKILPDFISGKAAYNYGYLKKFKEIADKNISFLTLFKNNPIIALEPTIYSFFKEEYSIISKKDLKITSLNKFLHQNLTKLKAIASKKNKITTKTLKLFLHCTEKTDSLQITSQWQDIFNCFNLKISQIDSSCCGMAGDYGYKTEYLNYSEKLANLSFDKALQSKNILIIATGFSCRGQIKRFNKAQVEHPVTLLLTNIIKNN